MAIHLDQDFAPGPAVDSNIARIKKMWATCFHLGVEEYKEAVRRGKPELEPAIEWLHCDEQRPGSFNWLCGVFNFDADRVRSEIAKRLEEKTNDRR